MQENDGILSSSAYANFSLMFTIYFKEVTGFKREDRRVYVNAEGISQHSL